MERLATFALVVASACTIGEGGPVADAPSPPIRVPSGAQPIAVTTEGEGSAAALRGLEERVEHALVGAGVRVVTRDRLSVADEEARRQMSPRYASDGAVALGRLLGARAVGVVSIDDIRVDTRVHILTHHHYGSLSTSFTLIDVETGEILLARRTTVRVDRRAAEMSGQDVEELMLDAAVERLIGGRRG
ncbi:MAG: hypothetical protein HYY06_14275 [Deltaproteobacteria bacterium]|nr:hypothetical protein [Deltaproteobacteria bacterium]